MNYNFYVGCYTQSPEEKGIHFISLDTDTGKFSYKDSYFGGEKPSFLIRKGDYIYAANEVGSKGMVSVMSVGSGGELTYINSGEVSGAGTCHVAEMNGYVYAANYMSGNIFGVKVMPDGSLGKVVAEIQHEGSGPNPNRQTKTYAHSVNPVPGDNMLIAADLGADKFFCYRQNDDGSLTPDKDTPFLTAPAGGGPRHLAFNPDGNRFYAVMEMGVTLAGYKKVGGIWEYDFEYPLLDGPFTEADTAADIHFISSGKRLYASVRGQNLISLFNVAESGSVTLVGSYPTCGKRPRNFCITPDEKYMLIANQESGQTAACPIIPDTGELMEATDYVDTPKASCVINA